MEEWYLIISEIKEWMFFVASILLILVIFMHYSFVDQDKYKKTEKRLKQKYRVLLYFDPNNLKGIVFLLIVIVLFAAILSIVFPLYEGFGVTYLIRHWYVPLVFSLFTFVYTMYSLIVLLKIKRESN